MRKLKLSLRVFSTICLIYISISSFAQDSPHKVGISIGVDHMITLNEPSFKIGFSYEWVPKWCGIETGVSWRTNGKTFPVYVGNNKYIARINPNYLTIPLLWRVHLKYVNFSLGAEIDYYLGYTVSESKTTDGLSIDSYSESRINPGAALKVGFPIALTKNWIIEPELRANLSAIDFFVGLGVAIRFGR